jgi:alkylation response protein AidB-like acyl-CoA dehydrogenase
MHALLDEEQEALLEMAADLARDLGTEHPSDLETELAEQGWQTLVQTGLVGLHAPEELGGGGASGVELAVVAEQLGRYLAREPYVGSAVFAAELARLSGADDYLRRLCDGTLRATVALTPELDAIAAVGTPGAVAWDCAGCDQALMLDGGTVVAADLQAAPVDSIDVTRELWRIDPAAPHAAIGSLTSEDETRWLTVALTGLTADLVGVMAGALALAVRYAGEREQFGAPIGSFQAIAHLCADQAVSVSAARSTLNYVAWCIDQRPSPEALRAARTAKAFAAEASRTVCEAAIQVHGGIGITWECSAHLYLRRALMSRQVLGDERHHLRKLADERGVA